MIAAGPPHSGLILANCRAGQAMKTSPRPCARRRGSAPGYRLYLSLTTRQSLPYRGGSDGARPSLPDGDPSRLAVSGAAIGRWDKPNADPASLHQPTTRCSGTCGRFWNPNLRVSERGTHRCSHRSNRSPFSDLRQGKVGIGGGRAAPSAIYCSCSCWKSAWTCCVSGCGRWNSRICVVEPPGLEAPPEHDTASHRSFGRITRYP